MSSTRVDVGDGRNVIELTGAVMIELVAVGACTVLGLVAWAVIALERRLLG